MMDDDCYSLACLGCRACRVGGLRVCFVGGVLCVTQPVGVAMRFI